MCLSCLHVQSSVMFILYVAEDALLLSLNLVSVTRQVVEAGIGDIEDIAESKSNAISYPFMFKLMIFFH